ncbi:hypothetical protein R1flu_014095 [Riccia fluitans]|uniref:Uncharacterized protein n=1 Tax=Riccia fluitans TaxID=41844 RepID=A0ABD1YIK7_9MARC
MASCSQEEDTNSLDSFVVAWKRLRTEVKQLQYKEVKKLSTLDTLRRQLERVTGDGTNGEQDRVLELSDQVAKLQAWEEHR